MSSAPSELQRPENATACEAAPPPLEGETGPRPLRSPTKLAHDESSHVAPGNTDSDTHVAPAEFTEDWEAEMHASGAFEIPPPIDLTTREASWRCIETPLGVGPRRGPGVSFESASSPVSSPARPPLQSSSNAVPTVHAVAESIHQLSSLAAGAARGVLQLLTLGDNDDDTDNYTAVNERISYNRGLLRKFSYFAFQNAKSMLALWLVFAVTELLVVSAYISGTTRIAEPTPRWTSHDDVSKSTHFYVRVILCFVSIPQLGFTFALDTPGAAALITTNLYQLAVFFASTQYPDISRYYVPLFLRVWTLRCYLLFIIDGVKVLSVRHPYFDAARALANPLLSFVALLITFTGIYRVNEAFQGVPTSFVEAFYCMAVTCSTVGYGDVTPGTTSGKVLIVLFIFAFIAELPVVLALLTSMSEYLASVKGFTGRTRHVVVVGSPTYKEVLTFLNEVIVFSGSRTIVFVMLCDVTDKMKALESNPLYRNRVSFVRIEYLRDPLLMSRSKAELADAIFIVSDKKTICAHGDYTAMMVSRVFDRYCGSVPQFLALRYGTHTSLLDSHHHVIVFDVMKKAILASALLMPGIIPFLVNLVRLSGSKGVSPPDLWSKERQDDWSELYRYSRRNGLHTLRCPDSLVGVTCRALTLALAEHSVVLVGVCESDEAKPVLLLSRTIQKDDLLVLLAGGSPQSLPGVFRAATASMTAVSEQYKGGDEEMLTTSNTNVAGHLMDSFYPFARTYGGGDDANNTSNLSATALLDGSSFAETALNLRTKYPFLPAAPRGIELQRLVIQQDEQIVLACMLAHYDDHLRGGDLDAAEKVKGEILSTLDNVADAQLRRLLDEQSRRRSQLKQGTERVVLIDQATSVGGVMLSEFDEDFAAKIAEQSLVMMMQCIRSIYAQSNMTLLTLNTCSSSFTEKWQQHFGQPLRVIKGQGTLLPHVEHALRTNRLHTSVRGVLLFCSQQGKREYEDVPILTVEKNVQAVMQRATEAQVLDPLQERHVIVELRTFTSCALFSPKHIDVQWLREGEDSFQSSLPFMMGKCFSTDMLQTLLVHTFYQEPILQWFELILSVSVRDARVEQIGPDRQRTRFKMYGNAALKLRTFRDAFRFFLKHRDSICVGVFRRFPKSAALDGTPRYFITNPHPEMPLKDDDVFYALFAGVVNGQEYWNQLEASMTASASTSRNNSMRNSTRLSPGEMLDVVGY